MHFTTATNPMISRTFVAVFIGHPTAIDEGQELAPVEPVAYGCVIIGGIVRKL
jgi:hypothetical protein